MRNCPPQELPARVGVCERPGLILRSLASIRAKITIPRSRLRVRNDRASATESLSLGIPRSNHRIARASGLILQMCGSGENHFPEGDGQFAAKVSVGKFGATV